MTTPLGSAAPAWFPEWIGHIAYQLIVGGPPAAPPVAWDGVGGDADAVSVAEATFANTAGSEIDPDTGQAVAFSIATITRTDGGSFLDDKWRVGMTALVAASTDNDGSYAVVIDVTADVLTFFRSVEFVAEVATPDVSIIGSVADGFALYVGKQWLPLMNSPSCCVIVPSFGEESQLMAFRTIGDRRPLGAVGLGIDIHIWGGEDASQAESPTSIWHDIKRFTPACEILQNVLRAVYYSSAAMGLKISQVTGWENGTQILEFGAALVASVSCSFPYYDFAATPVELPQELSSSVTIKQPGD